jgi:hypothetical protein
MAGLETGCLPNSCIRFKLENEHTLFHLKFLSFAKKINAMPELVVRYSNQRTLQMLTDLAKYFDFEIAKPKARKKMNFQVNGVTVVSGDESIDISPLSAIYSGREIDSAKLRQSAWQRS